MILKVQMPFMDGDRWIQVNSQYNEVCFQFDSNSNGPSVGILWNLQKEHGDTFYVEANIVMQLRKVIDGPVF